MALYMENVNLEAIFGQLFHKAHRSFNFAQTAWQRRKPLRRNPSMRTCSATMLYRGMTGAVHPFKRWAQLQSPSVPPVPGISTQDWPPNHLLQSEKDAKEE
jgi:hypothetical protein